MNRTLSCSPTSLTARSRSLSLVVVLAAVAAPSAALADDVMTAADLRTSQDLAIENYDLGDYAAARDQLLAANARADKAGLAKNPASARTHLVLGAVYTRMGAADEAVEAFKRALTINPDAALEPRLDSAEAKANLAKAHAILHPVVDCATLPGVAHEMDGVASHGVDKAISALVGTPLDAGSVSLYYLTAGSAGYVEVAMEKAGDCAYAGTIPAAAIAGESVRYYIEAKTKAGRPAAAKGSVRAPFVLTVQVTNESPPEVVKDEVPDNLVLNKKNAPKSGGCAGCQSSGDAGSLALLALVAGLALRRRRAPMPG